MLGAFGCGQCLPCRIKKRRTWTHRILLEMLDHGEKNCSFVTLTYSDERRRKVDDEIRSLNPRDLQDWLKRLRKRVATRYEGRRIRFFACGEYGDQTERPHYHAALFGHPHCFGYQRISGVCPCPACSDVRETWDFGHVMVGQLTAKSAAYIAGYVTKKMTHRSDIRLGGRHPEFARMSLRPGIGVPALWTVASDMMRYNLELRGDVPIALRYGAKMMPLGPFMRRKLRTMVGLDEKCPQASLQDGANRLSILRAYAFDNARSVASVFSELNSPYADQIAARLSQGVRKL